MEGSHRGRQNAVHDLHRPGLRRRRSIAYLAGCVVAPHPEAVVGFQRQHVRPCGGNERNAVHDLNRCRARHRAVADQKFSSVAPERPERFVCLDDIGVHAICRHRGSAVHDLNGHGGIIAAAVSNQTVFSCTELSVCIVAPAPEAPIRFQRQAVH